MYNIQNVALGAYFSKYTLGLQRKVTLHRRIFPLQKNKTLSKIPISFLLSRFKASDSIEFVRIPPQFRIDPAHFDLGANGERRLSRRKRIAKQFDRYFDRFQTGWRHISIVLGVEK